MIVVLVGGYVATLASKPPAPSGEFTSLKGEKVSIDMEGDADRHRQRMFTSLKGEKVSIDSLRGKVVLVNFWVTDCPGCIAEMPDLIKTHHKYAAAGLATVAVAMSYDPPNYVLAYTQKNALPFIVSLDPRGRSPKRSMASNSRRRPS